MDFNVLNIRIPETWLFLAALFFGAAVSQATMIPSRAKNPDAVRARKWPLCWVFLSLAFAFAVCAVFFPGPEKILDKSLAVYFGVVSGVFFLAFRFKRILGPPVFFLLVIAVVTLIMTLKPWRDAGGPRGGGEPVTVAELTVLSRREDGYHAEVRVSEDSAALELPAEDLAAHCYVLTLHDYYLVGGGKTFYRFGGFTAFSQTDDGTVELPWEDEASGSPLLSLVLKRGNRIPGIRVDKVSRALPALEPLRSFRIELSADRSELAVKAGLTAEIR